MMIGARAAVELLALVAVLAGCASLPPSGWQHGGRQLLIVRARWVNGDALVDVDHEGRVLLNGKHVLNVDRAGRVYDAYDNPVALLQEDGYLIGPDGEPMGWVGAKQAILPGDEEGWLKLEPSGLLLRVDDDGAWDIARLEHRRGGGLRGPVRVSEHRCGMAGGGATICWSDV